MARASGNSRGKASDGHWWGHRRGSPFVLGLALACAAAPDFPPRPPLWRDEDRRPFAAQLEPYYSPHDWDRIEKSVVLPISDALAVRTVEEAINVNSLDEVADSSWYENRAGRFPMSPEHAARGPCTGDPPVGPWRIRSAKPDGATPGFVFEAPDGQRYLAKMDGSSGNPRASLADVLGSRIYHAAGYRVPCNAIAAFDESMLVLAPDAHADNELGERVPLTAEHLEAIVRKSLRQTDGRYRSVVSQYLEGRPLGPWRYHGLRVDDRNDIVRHEDRRELRASRLLAAWTDHVDQREGNTLAMWLETAPGQGYVMHHLLDFGDCFGSVWGGSAQEAWRRGHDYWLDFGTVLVDWVTLGSIERPWDRATLGPLGLAIGYYDVASFDAERWRPRYPNPAFSHMTEHDAAWMARIIARIGPDLLSAMLEQAQAPPAMRSALYQILLGRRQKLLERYLGRLSPLGNVTLRTEAGGTWLCAVDLSAVARSAQPRSYQAYGWTADDKTRGPGPLPVRARSDAEHCVSLPKSPEASPVHPSHLIVELSGAPRRTPPFPIRFHLYASGAGGWLLAGIERLAA